jgi:O-antigen ligase
MKLRQASESVRQLQSRILILLVWAWCVIPRTVQTLTAPKYRTQVGMESPPYSTATAVGLLVLTLAVLGYSIVIILAALRNPPSHGTGALVVLLLPWIYLQLRNWTLSEPLQLSQLIYPIVAIAIWALRPDLSEFALLGYLVGVVAVISMIIGFFLPSQGILRSAQGLVITEDKTLLPFGILVGIFTHGNNLGQFLVLGLPMVAVIRHRFTRTLLVGIVCFALVWSASRSSLITSVIVIMITAAVALLSARLRGLPARVFLTAPFAAVALLPLVTSDPEAFTTRGFIWMASLAAWTSNPFFGLGSRYYQELGRTSESLGGTVFHGHNQLVHLLVTGGLVLLILVALMLFFCIDAAARWAERGRLVAVAYLTGLAGVCALEVSLVFVDNTFLFPVVVMPLAIILFSEQPELGTPRLAQETGDVDDRRHLAKSSLNRSSG